jgi:hypothetical protein
MKIIGLTAAFLACALPQPAAAQTTCSEAFAGCQKHHDGLRCDVVCKTYCSKERKACMKTGNFAAKNQKWTGLEKK